MNNRDSLKLLIVNWNPNAALFVGPGGAIKGSGARLICAQEQAPRWFQIGKHLLHGGSKFAFADDSREQTVAQCTSRIALTAY